MLVLPALIPLRRTGLSACVVPPRLLVQHSSHSARETRSGRRNAAMSATAHPAADSPKAFPDPRLLSKRNIILDHS
jgi:hypothetical protein